MNDSPESQWETYPAEQTIDPEAPQWSTYQPGEVEEVDRKIGSRIVTALVAAGIIGIAGFGVARSMDPAADTAVESAPYVQDQVEPPTMYTRKGIRDLADALEEELGSTQILQVAVFKDRATVIVPPESAGGEPRVYMWDGRLRSAATLANAREPMDLRDLDGRLLKNFCGGTDPDSCVAVVGAPLPNDYGAWITVAGSNGTFVTDLAGRSTLDQRGVG